MNDEMYDQIHKLFQDKQYYQVYQKHAAIFNQMLSVTSECEFEDFLSADETIDESEFWLFYAVQIGKSIAIGAYEEDVTAKVRAYLQNCLPNNLYDKINYTIKKWYVDIDVDSDFEKQITICNQKLEDSGYVISLQFYDTYCAGVYFLTIHTKE